MDHIQTQAQQQQQALLNPPRPPPSGSMDSLLMHNPTLASAATFSPPQLAPSFPTDDYSALFSQGPLFHSSYGAYQPVTGPLARFLTPSPGPSLLGNFEDISDGLADFRREEADANNGERTYESMWQDFDNGPNGHDEDGGTRDPFAGMTLAGRSGAASPVNGERAGAGPSDETSRTYQMDLESLARRMDVARGSGRETELESLERLAARVSERDGRGGGGGEYEQSTMANHPPQPPILPRGFPPLPNYSADRAAFELPQSGMHFLDHAASYASYGHRPSSAETSPQGLDDPLAADQAGPSADDAKPKKAPLRRGKGKKDDAPSKKNRNPHATQLPGSGARKLPKVEAGEGHEGPSCSHCSSIATPLWRRGPDDELLCNACVLAEIITREVI